MINRLKLIFAKLKIKRSVKPVEIKKRKARKKKI